MGGLPRLHGVLLASRVGVGTWCSPRILHMSRVPPVERPRPGRAAVEPDSHRPRPASCVCAAPEVRRAGFQPSGTLPVVDEGACLDERCVCVGGGLLKSVCLWRELVRGVKGLWLVGSWGQILPQMCAVPSSESRKWQSGVELVSHSLAVGGVALFTPLQNEHSGPLPRGVGWRGAQEMRGSG